MLKHEVLLSKRTERQVSEANRDKQLFRIRDRICNASRKARGWDLRIATAQPQNDDGWTYFAKLTITCKPKRKRSEDSLESEWNAILKVLVASASAQKWQVDEIDDETFTQDDAADVASRTMGYTDVVLPGKWRSFYEHIYDRDAQIDVVVSAIRAAVETNFQKRFHVLLYGPPACGKTEIVRATKRMIGEEACLEYDCTNTTAAGAIKDITEERDLKPRLLLLEEGEKADSDSLRWLLSVMDDRAEIRKVNFKTNISTDFRALTIATVNDYKLFKTLMSGALESRFAHKLYCPRPSALILRRILEREIETHGGHTDWIDPSIAFAAEHRITDPRTVTAICLSGREELLDGSYQEKLAACMQPSDAEEDGFGDLL